MYSQILVQFHRVDGPVIAVQSSGIACHVCNVNSGPDICIWMLCFLRSIRARAPQFPYSLLRCIRSIADMLQVLSVRGSHEGATAEALAESFSQGSYSKVLEFAEFQRRGRDSMTYLEADSQQALAALRAAAKTAVTVAGSGKVAAAVQRLGSEAWSLLEELDMADSMAGRDAAELWVNDDLSQLPSWLAPHACERCSQ